MKSYKTLKPPRPDHPAIPKERWYRIEDRERTRFPLDLKKHAGKRVRWTQSVVHIGYWYTPTDMPLDECDTQTLQLALWRVNRALQELGHAPNHPWQYTPFEWEVALQQPWLTEPLTEAQLFTVLEALHVPAVHAFQRARYDVRYRWWKAQMQKVPEPNGFLRLRTMWFFKHEPLVGTVQRQAKLAVVGKQSPAHRYSSMEGEEYDPPEFEPYIRQPLYFALADDPNPLTREWLRAELQIGQFRIHPEDAEWLETGD